MNKYKQAYDVIDAFLWSVFMEESERNPTLDEAEEAMDTLQELVEEAEKYIKKYKYIPMLM